MIILQPILKIMFSGILGLTHEPVSCFHACRTLLLTLWKSRRGYIASNKALCEISWFTKPLYIVIRFDMLLSTNP